MGFCSEAIGLVNFFEVGEELVEMLSGSQSSNILKGWKYIQSLSRLKLYLFLYVAISSILSWLLPLPELIHTLLSLPSLVILPWMAGSMLLTMVLRYRKFCFNRHP